MVKLFKIIAIMGVPVVLWGLWGAPEKDYGLEIPFSLGELCSKAKKVIIGEVRNIRSRISSTPKRDFVQFPLL